MATDNNSGAGKATSALADRLMARSGRARGIGAGSALFRRLGLANPYEGGAVGDPALEAGKGMFSFLSSRAYFDELRGLSLIRRHMMWRIDVVRHQIRAAERLNQTVATHAVRAAMLGGGRGADVGGMRLVDWSTQIDAQPEGEPSVAVPAGRSSARAGRPVRATAAERALRAQIAQAGELLTELQKVVGGLPARQRAQIEARVKGVEGLPQRAQIAEIRRAVRGAGLRTARGSRIADARDLGDRPMAVAQARFADDAPAKGLRRQLAASPVIMTLEQPAEVALVPPRAERPVATPAIGRAHAHREVPVSAAALQARTQRSTGRAGPVRDEGATPRPTFTRSAPALPAPRPTERIARRAVQTQSVPLNDLRRGLQASGADLSVAPVRGIERRVAARAEAGLLDARGSILSGASYARPERVAELGAAPGELARVAFAEDADGRLQGRSGAGPDRDARSARSGIERAAPAQVLASAPVRGDADQVDAQARAGAQAQADAQGLPRSGTSVRRAGAGARHVRRALPPVARAIQRGVVAQAVPLGQGSARAQRVGLAAPPVARAVRVDRRALDLTMAGPVAARGLDAGALPIAQDLSHGGAARSELGRRAVRGPLGASPEQVLAQGALAPAEADGSGQAVARPEVPVDRARTTAQRALVAEGPSRRGRALPTVRAASRALAQERSGARGRLLSPAVTGHLAVRDAAQALAPESRWFDREPRIRATSDARAVRGAGDVLDGPRAAVGQRAEPIADRGARGAQRASRAAMGPPSDVQGVLDALSPRRPAAVAPQRVLAQGPVDQGLSEGLAPVTGRAGLAARASDRALRPSARSVMPEVTPEQSRRVEAARRLGEQARTTRSVGVRTASGDTPITYAHRTVAGAVERSVAQRTMGSPTSRSLAQRTPAEALERSVAHRTAAALREGGAVRAMRRLNLPDPDQAVFARPFAREADERLSGAAGRLVAGQGRERPVVGPMDPDGGATAGRGTAASASGRGAAASASGRGMRPRGRASVRALGRGTPRVAERSVVPRPVNEPSAARERVARWSSPEPTLARAQHTGGMGLGTGGIGLGAGGMDRGVGQAEGSSIAGGARGTPSRPGAPDRSRMARALRAATVHAGARPTAALLTLPAAQRAFDGADGSDGGRRFTARVEQDAEGRLVRSTVVDELTGLTLAEPTRWVEERGQVGAAQPRERAQRAGSRLAGDARGRVVPAERSADGGPADRGPSPVFAAGGVRGSAQGPMRSGIGLDGALGALVGGRAPSAVERRPLLRRRAWLRRGMAAELGTLAPTLADADHAPAPELPEGSPSWVQRAVRGTSATATDGGRPGDPAREGRQDAAPRQSGLMSALTRAEGPQDLVQVIVQRGAEVSSLRGELPTEAVRLVERIAALGPEEVAVLRSGRVLPPEQTRTLSRRSPSRNRKTASEPLQLSAGHDGMGPNKIARLADKLMNLIHLAENSRQREAQDQVRMARDTTEARAEGGAKVPGMSVEDYDMNINALQRAVLDSVLENFEELDSRREDPDGRNKWW